MARISNRLNGAFSRAEEAPRLKALGYSVIRSPLLLGIFREIRKKETLFPEKPIVEVTCIRKWSDQHYFQMQMGADIGI